MPQERFRVPKHLAERVREEWKAAVSLFEKEREEGRGNARLPADILDARADKLGETDPELAAVLKGFAAEVRRVGRIIRNRMQSAGD